MDKLTGGSTIGERLETQHQGQVAAEGTLTAAAPPFDAQGAQRTARELLNTIEQLDRAAESGQPAKLHGLIDTAKGQARWIFDQVDQVAGAPAGWSGSGAPSIAGDTSLAAISILLPRSTPRR